MDLMRLDTPTLLAGIRDFDFHRRHEQSESESESRSESSLMGLPIEIRLKIYRHCVDEPTANIDKLLTIELSPQPYAFSANGNNVILQVNDVDPGIAALFGVCRQLRREVKDFFWRYYRLRIRPVSMVLTRFDGIESTFRQLRRLFLEVQHCMPKRDYTFNVESLLKHMSWFLRLPLLEDMDVLINTCSLKSLIPPGINKRAPVHGYCPRHKEYISESPVLQQLAISLDRFEDYLWEVVELWDSEAPGLPEGGQLHFRFHMTQQALLRTHDKVTRKQPSLRVRGNNSLAPCHAHSVLGSSELVTCRMLHAIEEDSTYHELVQDMRYHLIRTPDHYSPDGIPVSPTWTEEGLEMPRVISLIDLRERMSTNTPPPSLEVEDMFDMFYSREPPERAT
ncbi:hypothetical protein LTR99_003877 [Exophiala xenobiotica]|uniref:F-box domain-containing protein n=1 Tax=Vermiconidia calcicola TaxID=1690605 RepID=A0AAV9PUH9_9PEZI|nr:hypothetical protein LTR96_006418 [Exophiala xenobiotica]KAK5529803.1 hypothetical protein LTR25_009583 [Vermiconidia calcicola]KAK5548992.1 hypothetical protein LTR23_000821 [Chaetothyriales sp. CCFEE 6169]KAK5304812.1 hypothetical protein LTR99_003877 [Exophiala xenobiotica]KAK5336904.1 hypothetical protein LTR98_007211 [Exophiala xenobiotica]